MVNKKSINKDLRYLKKQVTRYLSSKRYDKALDYIVMSAKLMYEFAVDFIDIELEDSLSRVVNDVFGITEYEPDDEIVMFYDYYALPNRGLTQQYMRGLANTNKKVYYLVPKKKENIDRRIINEFESYNNVSLLFIQDKNLLQTVSSILEVVNRIKPKKVFMHMSPWDVVGNLVWNSCTSSERYNIDITDHTFWLGKNCTDFILEWRDYGATIAQTLRGFSREKIIVIPYYPILDSERFYGYEFLDKDHSRVRLFSGGHIFKIYGQNDFFLNLIKSILEQNLNTDFYYIGGGNTRYVKKFIDDNGLSNRWYMVENRKDIVEFIEKMDVFVHTYPISGGLMCQIAAGCKKPTIAYSDSWNTDCLIEPYFHVEKLVHKLTYFDRNEMLNEIKLLCSNKDYRESLGENEKEALIEEKEFILSVAKITSNETIPNDWNSVNIDLEKIQQMYIEIQNYTKTYLRIFLNKTYATRRPITALLRTVSYLSEKMK